MTLAADPAQRPRKGAPALPVAKHSRQNEGKKKTHVQAHASQQKRYLLFLSGCKSKDSFRHAFLISDCDADRFTFCGCGGEEEEGGQEGELACARNCMGFRRR